MKFNSSIFSSSAFNASKAYIEKHDAAIFRRAPGWMVCLRSSPSRRLMLSISSIRRSLSKIYCKKRSLHSGISGCLTIQHSNQSENSPRSSTLKQGGFLTTDSQQIIRPLLSNTRQPLHHQSIAYVKRKRINQWKNNRIIQTLHILDQTQHPKGTHSTPCIPSRRSAKTPPAFESLSGV